MTNRSRGFTLTDILVTIFIIALLVAIALPILGRMHRSAEVSRKKADLNALTVALEGFKAKHGDYPRLNDRTLRKLFAGKFNSEEQFRELYNDFLSSQTRGSQLLTIALLEGGFLDSNFRTVEVEDVSINQTVRLLATHDDRPILYYPGLPVRPDLSKANGYVSAMGPAEVNAAIQAAQTTRRSWQLPLFNAYDNHHFLTEPQVQEEFGAAANGASRQAMPKYSGSYLLWAAGDANDLARAYLDDDAIITTGGGQPLVMVPGGSAVNQAKLIGYVDYIKWTVPDAPAIPNGTGNPGDFGGSEGDPGTGLVVRPVSEGPPPGWKEHEVPPRTPKAPPGDAIDITKKGAKPNDGIDDWKAIKDALEEARQKGTAIVVPPGDFDLSQPLDVGGGSQIYGPGALKINNGHDYAMKVPAGADGILIDGVELVGGGINGAGRANGLTITNNLFRDINHRGAYNNGSGINFNGGLTNSTIQQNHFVNIAQEGIWINTIASGVNASYNAFSNVWQCMHIISNGAASGIKLNHNFGVGMTRMGIEFQGEGAVDSEIIGNTFKDWKEIHKDGGSFGLSIYNLGRGTQIKNNMLQAPGNAPVGIEMGGMYGVASGNVIEGFREGMHVIQAGNSTITGNTFRGQTWMSIWFPGYGGSGTPNTNVHVTNNAFELGAEAAILFMGGGWGGARIEGNTAKLGSNTQFVKSHSGMNGIHVGANDISR